MGKKFGEREVGMYEMGSYVYEITPLLSILRLTTEKEGARLALLGHDFLISRAKDFLEKMSESYAF